MSERPGLNARCHGNSSFPHTYFQDKNCDVMSFSMMVSWLSLYTIGLQLQGLYAQKNIYLFLFCVFEPWVLRSTEIFCGKYIFIDTWLSNKVQMCKDEKTTVH